MSTKHWNAVVVPLDGSELSEKAIAPACELARRFEAPVFLVTVPEIVEPAFAAYPDFEARLAGMMPAEDLDAMREGVRAEAAEYLEQRARVFASAGVRVEREVGEGRPAEAIVASLRRHPNALLVMATHGRRGLSRWAFGSVADSVLQTIERAALLVPAAADHVAAEPRRVLVPLDGTSDAESILPAVAALAERFGAHVELVHVMPDFSDFVRAGMESLVEIEGRYERWLRGYMDGIREQLAEGGFDVSTRELSGPDVADALLAQSARDDVDLLAMTTGVHGEAVRGGTSGVVARILRNTRTPVLLKRSGERPGDS